MNLHMDTKLPPSMEMEGNQLNLLWPEPIGMYMDKISFAFAKSYL